ncbi:MAG: LytTR family DNA-binding domain-containing protein [Bacteroidales bacterium]|nr:LytTR family DNA-binding domain-containing protein [Bacteroidales bacterium]
MNCIVIDDDEAVGVYMQKLIEDTGFFNLLEYFSDPEVAVGYIFSHSNEIDIVFIDVEMPKLSGIELISSLGQVGEHIKFVVISSKEKYAIDALENNVVSYILKPLSSANFIKAVSKIKKQLDEKNHQPKDDNFFVKSNDGKYVKITWNDIYWIEVNKNNITLNTFDNNYTLMATLKDFSAKLPEGMFFKTHRSFIVNINHISIIDDNDIIMQINNKNAKIPLSRNYKPELLAKINVINKGN